MQLELCAQLGVSGRSRGPRPLGTLIPGFLKIVECGPQELPVLLLLTFLMLLNLPSTAPSCPAEASNRTRSSWRTSSRSLNILLLARRTRKTQMSGAWGVQ